MSGNTSEKNHVASHLYRKSFQFPLFKTKICILLRKRTTYKYTYVYTNITYLHRLQLDTCKQCSVKYKYVCCFTCSTENTLNKKSLIGRIGEAFFPLYIYISACVCVCVCLCVRAHACLFIHTNTRSGYS
jgi:hypothetical protein